MDSNNTKQSNYFDLCSIRNGAGCLHLLPALLAEELNLPLSMVKVEIAGVAPVYINAMLCGQITGGSTSVREAFDKLRTAGAAT